MTQAQHAEQKRQLALARKAYAELVNSGFETHVRRCLRLELKSEREHRTSIGDTSSFRRCHPHAAGVLDCAKLLVVAAIADFMQMERVRWPQGADFLSYKPSRLVACGIADRYGADVRKLWGFAGIEVADVAALDYVVAVSPENWDGK